MLTGASGYDIVVPSIEFMARQAKAGVFAKIDKAALSNYGNLDKAILEIIAVNDPGNTFGVPYMMFTTGIGYNIDAVSSRIEADKIGSWDMILIPKRRLNWRIAALLCWTAPQKLLHRR